MYKAYNTDIPMLRKVMEYIENNPRSWDQESFVSHCGTTFCLAGHALILSGEYKIAHNMRVSPLGDKWAEFVRVSDGESVDPQVEATKILGLSPAAGRKLFHTFTSDPSVLRSTIEEVVGERL